MEGIRSSLADHPEALETHVPEVLKDSSNCFDVTLAWILGIDQDVVKVYNDKDIKLLCQDIVNVV